MILRVLICIPTYNNRETIAQVTHAALAQTPHSVLVIDDGSDFSVSTLLKGEGPGRLEILRFERNRGKGVALQHAFEWATARGFTHVLSLDGDGQHLLSEAGSLLAAAAQNPWNLIIGRRRFDQQAHVPDISKLGRRFSNFWVTYQTRATIQDSQSGYRIYPLFHLQSRRFWSRRFDFEIEVLIRLLWAGVKVTEIEIDVHYPRPEERVSHFHKLWDNFRISLLNTALVVISLMFTGPLGMGMALATGFFLAPWAGLGFIAAAALTLALRLNLVFLLVGWSGSRILALPGGLRAAVALAAGSVVWFLAQRGRGGATSNWNGRARGGRLGNGFLRLVLRFLGLRAAYVLLVFIIPYFYLFAPRARRAADEYWRALRPHCGLFARQLLVLWQLFRFAQVLLDRGMQETAGNSLFSTNTNGLEHIHNAMRTRQPLILLSSHVGGWDLATSYINKANLSGRFHMVQYQPPQRSRNSSSVRDNALLTNEDPVLRIRTLLQQGDPVGLMADRPMCSNMELVSFFGKLIPIDTRPFRVAASCGSSLLFTFGFKSKHQAYDLYAQPAFAVAYRDDQPRSLQLRAWAQQYAQALERVLSLYPEQWFTFFPVFSSPPQAPPGLKAAREQNYLWPEWQTPPARVSESVPGPTAPGAE